MPPANCRGPVSLCGLRKDASDRDLCDAALRFPSSPSAVRGRHGADKLSNNRSVLRPAPAYFSHVVEANLHGPERGSFFCFFFGACRRRFAEGLRRVPSVAAEKAPDETRRRATLGLGQGSLPRLAAVAREKKKKEGETIPRLGRRCSESSSGARRSSRQTPSCAR